MGYYDTEHMPDPVVWCEAPRCSDGSQDPHEVSRCACDTGICRAHRRECEECRVWLCEACVQRVDDMDFCATHAVKQRRISESKCICGRDARLQCWRCDEPLCTSDVQAGELPGGRPADFCGECVKNFPKRTAAA